MPDIAAFAVKLALGVLTFVLVGWLGARDKRIGGVLLTFPLLNGIAMLTGIDPDGIARTIYPVCIWNCLLFLVAMHRYAWLPPLAAGVDPEVKVVARAGVWIALWAAGAALLTEFRDDLPWAAWLFAGVLVVAAALVVRRWRPAVPSSPPTFNAMWRTWRGLVRIACFIAAFLLLFAVAQLGSARWVGWASALPLPGIFALAILSVMQDKDEMRALGDTVLVGPLLVIPFNWLLSRAIVALRLAHAGTPAEIATVVVFWAVAAGAVFAVVPPLARWRDRAPVRA
jgi:hypothetical protein